MAGTIPGTPYLIILNEPMSSFKLVLFLPRQLNALDHLHRQIRVSEARVTHLHVWVVAQSGLYQLFISLKI